MRRANVDLEWRILKTWCNSTELHNKLSVDLSKKFFGTEPTNEVYRKLRYLADSGKDLPDFRDIPSVLSLSSETETALKTVLSDPDNTCTTIKAKSYDLSIEKLVESYSTRVAADMHAELGKIIQTGASTADIAALLEQTLPLLAGRNVDKTISMGAGVDCAAMDRVVDRALNGDVAHSVIPTYWTACDQRIGGWERGSVVLLTANSGGGKSIAANCIGLNQYKHGYKVANACLEMEDLDMVSRMLARECDVDSFALKMHNIDEADDSRIFSNYEKLSGLPGKYTIITPDDADLVTILNQVGPGYDVIYIDYLQLLRMSGDRSSNQEQRISECVRLAKTMARKLNCVIVLLSQRNKDGDTRGSQATEFHASYWLDWTIDDDIKARTPHVVQVTIKKARMGNTGDFALSFDLSHMNIGDLGANQIAANEKMRISNKLNNPKKAFDRRLYICDPDDLESDD